MNEYNALAFYYQVDVCKRQLNNARQVKLNTYDIVIN